MKNHPIHRETISTRERNQMIDITSRMQALVKKSNALNGMIVVYCPHTTAAITINENADPDVQHDLLTKLGELGRRRKSSTSTTKATAIHT